MNILTSKKLLDLLIKEINKKVTGEKETIRYLLLACSSVWVANGRQTPHTLIKSKSSAGKSFIAKKVLEIFPREIWVYKSRITPTALTYLKANNSNWTWDGKILYLEDIGEEVLNSDVHKVFLSEGSVESEIVTQAGRIKTFRVKGKPIEITTTAISEPKEELVNRYNQISLDETEVQTMKVNNDSAKYYETGKEKTYNEDITLSLLDLERVNVKVPYATKIAKVFPTKGVNSRRDFHRFIALIMSSCALHQKQRKVDSEGFYLAQKQDYDNALRCVDKLGFNEDLYSFTPLEKEMFEVCKKLSESNKNGFSVTEAFMKHPNVSQQFWYKKINEWSRQDVSMLSVSYETVQGVKQRVKLFKVIGDFQVMKLPKFQDLIKQKDMIIEEEVIE